MAKKQNTQPHKNAELGAVDNHICAYPSRKSSACSEVLARLLAGETLTAADTLCDASTMRAAAHVHYLSTRYGWPIVAGARAAGCADGRVALIATYHLPADCIHKARATGASEWCTQVQQARKELRTKAPAAFRLAASLNKVKTNKQQMFQGDLFDTAKGSN